MGKRVVLAAALVLIAAGSFFAGLMVERYLFAASSNSQERRLEALVEYLDGKTIDLQGKAGGDTPATSHTIRKDQIEAVQFPDTMIQMPGEPWRPDVTMILNTGKGRYFVRCVVPYHDIQDAFAFLEIEVLEVARQ